MKYINLVILCLFVFGCTNDSIENNQVLKSRSASVININTPSNYLVTDTTYLFELENAYGDYDGASWTIYPSTATILGSLSGAQVKFYKGGLYQINLSLYDYKGESVTYYGAFATAVFEKNPVILGESVIQSSTANVYTVDYTNVVSDYTLEWDIPSELSYRISGKELYLTGTVAGTYEIKCRVIEQCPLYNEAGIHVSNWSTKTITVIDQIRADDWCVFNPVVNSNGGLSFDLRYSSSNNGYRCYAMYYVVLYQGAYDGIYASQAWEWEKAWNESYYHPPVIDEDYGFVYCDWDYLDNESSILIGQDELFSRRRTISNFPSGKTIDDIEYIILFVRDNKGSSISQYSTECYFEYD